MPIPNKPNYTHGSTGTEPATSIDYDNGDPVDESEFDYFIYTEFNKIGELIDFLDEVDSDGDGVVDEADTANAYKGNDIDSNGDGKVDEADRADEADALTSLAQEGGEVAAPDDGLNTIEVDFSNDYEFASLTWSLETSGGIPVEPDQGVSAKWNDYIKNIGGDIVGASFTVQGNEFEVPQIRWSVMGSKA